MNAEHGRRVIQRHERRHGGPEVAAIGAVPLISQTAHQAVPQPRRIPACHPRPGRPVGESVARQRGDHYVKTGPVDAMRGRVRQPRHERQELGEATWPAICQDQRDPAAAAGPLVHKMHPDTIDPGSEVTKPVQPPFLRAPVEAIRPVPQQALQVTEVCALPPRSARRRPRPPRVQDPRTQVGEHLVAHPDIELLCPEGSHRASFAWCRRCSATVAASRPDGAATRRAHAAARKDQPQRGNRPRTPRRRRDTLTDLRGDSQQSVTPFENTDRRLGARLSTFSSPSSGLLTAIHLR